MKVRIVKRTHPDGTVDYQIQQKHFLFRWWWVPAWVNSGDTWVRDTFPTMEQAEANLCYFDGTKTKIEVCTKTE